MKIFFKTKAEIYTLFFIVVLSTLLLTPVINNAIESVDWSNYSYSSLTKRIDENKEKQDLKLKEREENRNKK